MNPESLNNNANNQDKEPLLEELGAINEELRDNTTGNTLSDEAVEAKERRKKELEALLEE